MPNDFDIAGAVDSIGEGLGLGLEADEATIVEEPAAAAPTEAPTATPATAKPASVALAQPAGEPTAAPVAAPAAPAGAPRTWKPEAAAEWDKVPPAVQAEIARREEDMFRGLEGYKQDAGLGKAFQSLMKPYEQFIQQTGDDVGQLMTDFMNAHTTFKLGTPEQKLGMLQQISKVYGLDLSGLAPADPDSQPFVDPQVQRLQAELASVKSTVSEQQRQQQAVAQREQEAVRARYAQEIDAFAADTATNPDFDLLADDIARLLRAKEATGLRDAYDKAVWLNPVTRAKAVESAAAAQAEAHRKAQAEAAAKAKAATSANVRTSAKNASGTAASESMDDTMKAAYATIMGKQ